ncbi:MAG: MBOAT family O-acyltransferase [Candidatus Limivicinus sp.]|nr:MBOAT family O-acyltransferase [Candidatus Limivicinus sp.]
MVFSSIPFLYYFLPVVLMGYFLMPGRFKNGWLLLSSLVFYGWGEPKLLWLMVFTILLFYGCGLAMDRAQSKRGKKLWLILSVAVSLGLLGIFKYADFFIESFNALTGLSVPLLRLALPVGISFYTFQCLSYTIDLYRGNAQVQKNIVHFGAYVAMFPQLIAGPIVRYVDVERQLRQRQHSWEDARLGLRRFLVGLGKKVILADNFASACALYRGSGEQTVVFAWMYAAAFTLNIYFDFSGYSDMAIGLGKLFGFDFPENFNYPYISRSVTEFWRRWHISLGSWFRDYVYIPMGGNRVSRPRWLLNILVVWLLTGFWHGAAWNFIVWGLFFAVFLILEKLWLLKRLKKAPVLGRFYVLFTVMLSFIIFSAENMGQALSSLSSLFGAGGLPLLSAEFLYYLKSYAVLLLIAVVGATPLPRLLLQRLGIRPGGEKLRNLLEVPALLLILALSTAYLVDGSFNPFLYFRF